jgi:formylglycine-generating enzyme required for sulfatase activity
MVVVPEGSFLIGSPVSEVGRNVNEGPQHKVSFGRKFSVGKFAITFDEWDACVADGGCAGYRPADEGRRGRLPAINVSWLDAQTYVTWLSKKTGKTYRLLSEAEREYVTRAGTTSPFWFGETVTTAQANYDGRTAYKGGGVGEYRQRPIAVDALSPNPFGLYHVHGNVDEWVEDCWFGDHNQTPADGTARIGECGRRVLRGGSWYEAPEMLRSASRTGFYPGFRSNKIGFRVARPL